MKSCAVDIVVPIFNARDDVIRCVESVLRHATGDYRLVLVNDASTDEGSVRYLEQTAAARPEVLVIHAERNAGFVQTANLGMQAAADRDVLLLNSDTVVVPSFLERLQGCVYADDRTGIVTPFANNATICSFSRFCEDNPLPSGIPLDEYAEIIGSCSLRRRPEIVTAVGFCMYIRREVIEQVGLFDEIYGRGFGEENDFCEQAKRLGWKIRLCDDLFIAHTGKASFGDEGRRLEYKNMAVLLERFPDYLRDVTRFCESNPLAEVQANARYFVLRHRAIRHRALMHVIHSDPFMSNAGGTEHYVIDLVRAQAIPRALIVYPVHGALAAAEVIDGDVHEPLRHRFPVSHQVPKLAYEDAAWEAELERITMLFAVSLVHIHHLFNWPIGIHRVFTRLGVQYHYSIHDFFCVCPSHNLFDFSTMSRCPCALEPARTGDCLAAYGRVAAASLARPDADGVREHRACFQALVDGAQTIIAPSNATVRVVEERLTLAGKARIIPHGYDAPAVERRTDTRLEERLQLAVLGNVNYPNKGSEAYLEAVRATPDRPVVWHFFGDLAAFGYAERLRQAGGERVILHGSYRRQDIVACLADNRIDAGVLMPACDETFSFTLSELLLAGVPVLALRRGSLTERMESCGLGELLYEDEQELIGAIRTLDRVSLEGASAGLSGFAHRTVRQCAADVLDSYGPAGAALREERPPITRERCVETFVAHFELHQAAEHEVSPVVTVRRVRSGGIARILEPFMTAQRLFEPRHVARALEVVERLAFPAAARASTVSDDTVLIRNRLRGSLYRSRGRDPFIVFPECSVRSADIDAIWLRIRCSISSPSRAQLFWAHDAEEPFSEAKSVHLPVNAVPWWQNLILDLRRFRGRNLWTAGECIVRLRLDPLECEGEFELRELSLCRFAPKSDYVIERSIARA